MVIHRRSQTPSSLIVASKQLGTNGQDSEEFGEKIFGNFCSFSGGALQRLAVVFVEWRSDFETVPTASGQWLLVMHLIF